VSGDIRCFERIPAFAAGIMFEYQPRAIASGIWLL